MPVDMKGPPPWLKYFNKVVIGVHRIGLKLPMYLLTVKGAKSGKGRTTPITPFVIDGRRYAVGALPKSDWVRNARAAGEGTLTQGRRSQRVHIVELSPEDSRPILRQFPVLVPTGVSFVKNAGLVKDGTPDEFEQLAGISAVFRLDPAQ